HLNVARADTAPFSGKATLSETSTMTPCLVSVQGYLYIAWAGGGNGLLNGMISLDAGASFGFRSPSPTQTSPLTPTLCTDNGKAYIAWTGSDNGWLNVAKVMVSLPRRGSLTPGQYLAPGSKLASPNGMFTLTYTTRGNLVLRNWKQQKVWS